MKAQTPPTDLVEIAINIAMHTFLFYEGTRGKLHVRTCESHSARLFGYDTRLACCCCCSTAVSVAGPGADTS